MSIHAFLDPGFQSGDTYRRMLLGSTVFGTETIKGLIRGKKTGARKDLVKRLAHEIVEGDVRQATVALALASQPRQWLAIRVGRHKVPPDDLQDAADLLEAPGDEEWHGPVVDPATPDCRWFVRPFSFPYHSKSDGGITKLTVRWFLFARVEPQVTSFHWDGFTHQPEPETPRQFRYWDYVPGAIDELETLLRAKWEIPNLNELILHDLWKKYVDAMDSGYDWKHRHIRAEGKGVALSARSGGIEMDETGIRALTTHLASAAAKAAGISDAAMLHKMGNAILGALIQDWGARSYEFSLDKMRHNKTVRQLFRGHTYFGGKVGGGIDSLQHVKAYEEYGASHGALAFLLKELGLT